MCSLNHPHVSFFNLFVSFEKEMPKQKKSDKHASREEAQSWMKHFVGEGHSDHAAARIAAAKTKTKAVNVLRLWLVPERNKLHMSEDLIRLSEEQKERKVKGERGESEGKGGQEEGE